MYSTGVYRLNHCVSKMRHGVFNCFDPAQQMPSLPVLQIFKSTYSKRWQAVHFAEPGSQRLLGRVSWEIAERNGNIMALIEISWEHAGFNGNIMVLMGISWF